MVRWNSRAARPFPVGANACVEEVVSAAADARIYAERRCAVGVDRQLIRVPTYRLIMHTSYNVLHCQRSATASMITRISGRVRLAGQQSVGTNTAWRLSLTCWLRKVVSRAPPSAPSRPWGAAPKPPPRPEPRPSRRHCADGINRAWWAALHHAVFIGSRGPMANTGAKTVQWRQRKISSPCFIPSGVRRIDTSTVG